MSEPKICSYAFCERVIGSGTENRAHGTVHSHNLDALRGLSLCRYCGAPLAQSELDSSSYVEDWPNGQPNAAGWNRHSISQSLRLGSCNACGWWILQQQTDESRNYMGRSYVTTTQLSGEARHYEIDDVQVPMRELRLYLRKCPEDMALVHPVQFELVVRDCLRDYFEPCEIVHTGRSGDGGIDLKMVLTNEDTYLIQVKRRSNLARKEGVQVVRELNGVLFREGIAKGMIVTTAQSFTRGAFREREVRTLTKERYEMKLLAFDDIVSMLRLPQPERNVSSIVRQLAPEFREQSLALACSRAMGMWTTETTPVAHIPTATTTTGVC